MAWNSVHLRPHEVRRSPAIGGGQQSDSRPLPRVSLYSSCNPGSRFAARATSRVLICRTPRLSPHDTANITRILHQVRAGDDKAVGTLLPLVYAELRQLAVAVFSRERRDHTLQPTALVHEAWLKLANEFGEVEGRVHFYAVAAQAMRRILIDHARAHGRQKRSANHQPITFDLGLVSADSGGVDLLDLDKCLARLVTLNERHARMVELRFFAGMSIPETAEVLGVSTATVERDWFSVRAWLRLELGSE
jgi:RNA polymerase sigma-70 factor (ECF subfamily)